MEVFKIEADISELVARSQYGHVDHTDSIKLMERARVKYLENHGITLSELVSRDIFIVVSELKVEYMREVRGSSATVCIDGFKVERRRIVVPQRIVNADGKDAVLAEVQLACLSRAAGRAIVVPDFLASLGSVSKAP